MASVFTRIALREIPAYIVAEDERNMAILDINPLVEGHVLVFPKMEVDWIFDLPDADYKALMEFSKDIANALSRVYPSKRITMSVVGLEVPHAHIHLIPINQVSELNFSKVRVPLSSEDFQVCLDRLKSEF